MAGTSDRPARVDSDTVAAALAAAAELGPYFAVRTQAGSQSDWRPLSALYEQAAPLAAAVTRTRRALNCAEDRVAASIWFQGIAARLWSPVLAVAAARGLIVDLDPTRTYWRPGDGGPMPLLLTTPRGWRPQGGAATARALADVVVDGNLRPLAAAARRVAKLPDGLVWGNAASALVGAAVVATGARPALAVAVGRLVDALLGMPPLAVAGDYGGDLRFRRRSCCLYYRVPGGGLCGDCALDHEPPRPNTSGRGGS